MLFWGGREPQIIYYVLLVIRPGRGCSRGSRCRAGRSFARWPGRPASGRCWCPHEALGSGRGVAGGAMLTWSKCRSGTRRAAPPRSRRARRGSAARRWWHPHSSTTSQRPDDGVRVVVVPGSEVAVERVSRGRKQPPRAGQGHLGLELNRALWRAAICCRAAGRSAHLTPPHCRSGGRPARHPSAGFVVRRGWLAGGGAGYKSANKPLGTAGIEPVAP